MVAPRRQGRRLEAAVADGVCRCDGHLVEKGRVVASQGIHAEQLDAVLAGRYREGRRLVGGIGSTDRIDGAVGRAVDQDLDFLIIRLLGRALCSQERDLVGIGVQVHGLAHAAGVLEEADLRSGRSELGFRRDPVACHAGRSRELPGHAIGIGCEGICGQGRLRETSIEKRVDHRRDRHFVEEGGAVAALRTQTKELDAVRARRYREIRRLVLAVGRACGNDLAGDLRVGRISIDQDLDFLVLGLVVETLCRLEGNVVDAGDQVHGLADGGIVLEEGDLGAVGGVGISGGEGAGIAAHPAVSRECPRRAGRRHLIGVGGQCRRLETAVADAVRCQRGGRHQPPAFETFHRQSSGPGVPGTSAVARRPGHPVLRVPTIALENPRNSLVHRSQHRLRSRNWLLVRQTAQR